MVAERENAGVWCGHALTSFCSLLRNGAYFAHMLPVAAPPASALSAAALFPCARMMNRLTPTERFFAADIFDVDDWERLPPPQTEETMNTLRESRALIITGEPGIGKTTPAQHLVCQLCMREAMSLCTLTAISTMVRSVSKRGKSRCFCTMIFRAAPCCVRATVE